MACNATTLAADSRCWTCIEPRVKQAIRLRLLCAIRDGEVMACDPTTLADEAKCLMCMTDEMMDAAELTLLCTIAENGAGGGGGETVGGGSVLCGAVDPTTAPTTACAIYYRTDTGSIWIWDGGAWVLRVV